MVIGTRNIQRISNKNYVRDFFTLGLGHRFDSISLKTDRMVGTMEHLPYYPISMFRVRMALINFTLFSYVQKLF